MNESDFLNPHDNPALSRSQPNSPPTRNPIVDDQSASFNFNAQQTYNLSPSMFISPNKNLRGLKGADEIINDHELAHRRAEEAGQRRYQAAEWLRKMDQVASEVLAKEPTEEEFCLGLRNGLILCNVLNKVNPGAVHKVVENPVVVDMEATEGAAQSAIQYFENMRNFLVAVGKMKLLTFEASDLEKGGSSAKVVECILCLKGYFEWKQSGGLGVWRYGGTVRITSLVKEATSSTVSSEGADDSESESESLQYNQILQFLQLSTRSHEESREANVLTFMFDHFSLGLLKSYLAETETNGFDDMPLNSTVIDTVLKKVAKDFSALLASRGHQLGLYLNHVLNSDHIAVSKTRFLEAISKYLIEKSSLASRDIGSFCICGGKVAQTCNGNISCPSGLQLLNLQHKQLEGLKSLFKETKEEFHRVQLGLVEEVQSVGHHVKGLEVAASSYHKVLEENRTLYNQVQDLKGTIRVFCRVRPFLPGQPNEQSTVDYIGENGKIMIANPLKRKDARRVFLFNKVFGTNVTQQNIYDDTQQLIRSVLDGYNVCIFAYGQTGSGKTYTMSGPDLMTKETWGVNYRALCDLFHICKSRMDMVEYEVGVQMIEIYNEQVRDLLVSDGSNRRLDIRNNSQLNGLNVPDASLVPVKTSQDVFDLMKIGQRNRAVGATALNGRSSRSHSVLTVHVRGKELISGSILKGCLHLVDLAGSERLDKSEAVGERLKEAQHINKSLSALGDVISALAHKSSHIPYRNSKLTQVLQDSLGGHAKTLMFVHINPDVNALGETISTLKFAERVATIDLGAAQSNKETSEMRDFKEEISNLKLTLERKESELEQLKRVAVSVSPKLNTNASLNMKLEGNQLERRCRFPSKFVDKDVVLKMAVLGEKRSTSSIMPRYPSPSIRTSTPSAVVNVRTRLNQGSSKEHGIEEDQIKFSSLNVRQGGIRKAKPEGKVRIKQKSGVVGTGNNTLEEAQKINLSGPENEHGNFQSPSIGVKKLHHRNQSRDSHNVELRELIHTVEPSFYQENKVSSTVPQKQKHTFRPEIRRSVSTPRGRYMI